MTIKIKKLTETAKTPTYGTTGAACFDIYADMLLSKHVHQSIPVSISTGLAFEIPEDHVMLVFSRSGHGFKNNVRLSNCTGVIDSDYRGELMIKLAADNEPYVVNPGERIAQAMIIPVQRVVFEEVTELSTTKRGSGGFGSTN